MSEKSISNDTLRQRIGFWGQYSYNFHDVTNIKLPDDKLCCNEFKTGQGSGSGMGILLELPIANDFLIDIRIGYFSRGGLLESENEDIFFVDDTETPVIVRNSLDAELVTIGIETIYSYQLFDDFFLKFGFNAGYFILTAYDYNSQMIAPPNNSLNYNASKGNIEVGKIDASLLLGLSYDIPIDKDRIFFIVPELYYSRGITNVANEYWKINSFKAGFAFKYAPIFKVQKYIEKLIIDTLIIESDEIYNDRFIQGIPIFNTYVDDSGNSINHITEVIRWDTLYKAKIGKTENNLFADVKLYGLTLSDEKIPVNSIFAKVQLTKEIYPMLSYVFFNENSSQIPSRYNFIKMNKGFDFNKYYPNPIIYHRNILNIIADRMLKNPKATIKLTGYIDPKTEKGNCSLAIDRAEEVRNYLTYYCKIDKNRIKVSSNLKDCFPKSLTKATTKERFAENRKVLISSDNRNILAPIIGDKFQKATLIIPKKLIFDFSGSNLDLIDNWNLKLYQNENMILNFKDSPAKDEFEYVLSEEDVYMLRSDSPLNLEYYAFNEIGEYAGSKRKISVIIDTLDAEIERLYISLFNVADFRLDKNVKENIKSFLVDTGKKYYIYISGYTDILGGEENNIRLSDNRVKQVENYIKSLLPKAKIIRTESLYSLQFPPGISSYETAEERYLSRTVVIEIIKTQ